MLKDFLNYKMQEIQEESSSIGSTVNNESFSSQMFDSEISEPKPLQSRLS